MQLEFTCDDPVCTLYDDAELAKVSCGYKLAIRDVPVDIYGGGGMDLPVRERFCHQTGRDLFSPKIQETICFPAKQ